tara:strand:+ start:162 stop:320 length:159 start_codon:yes stop_codon:yes gene_type:complete
VVSKANRNPMAKSLSKPIFYQRKVNSKKVYNRKKSGDVFDRKQGWTVGKDAI